AELAALRAGVEGAALGLDAQIKAVRNHVDVKRRGDYAPGSFKPQANREEFVRVHPPSLLNCSRRFHRKQRGTRSLYWTFGPEVRNPIRIILLSTPACCTSVQMTAAEHDSGSQTERLLVLHSWLHLPRSRRAR